MQLFLSPQRVAGVAALACAAALTPVTAALAMTGIPAASSTPACATSGLVIWMNTVRQRLRGRRLLHPQFTNLSGRACTLHGYPGVSAVSLSGGRLGRPAGLGTATPTTVTLADGATAAATLQIADPANFGTACFLPGPPPAPGRPGKLPDGGRAARLPAGPVHLQGDPLSLQRLLQQRARLDARRTATELTGAPQRRENGTTAWRLLPTAGQLREASPP